MGRQNKDTENAAPAIGTSFGTKLDASSSTLKLFGTSTGRKRGRIELASIPPSTPERPPRGPAKPPRGRPRKNEPKAPDPPQKREAGQSKRIKGKQPIQAEDDRPSEDVEESQDEEESEYGGPKGPVPCLTEKRLEKLKEKRSRKYVFTSTIMLPLLMQTIDVPSLRFRPHPPQSFLEIHNRAKTQRFCVLSRSGSDGVDKDGEQWFHPYICHEVFKIAGSTGNVYTVHIDKEPSCDCPHAQKGSPKNQCKHIVFILDRVYRVKYELLYQLAFLEDEIQSIFFNAPIPVGSKAAAAEADKKRKPIEGDCPICFEKMEPKSRDDPLVWCEAACGQNIHRNCFDTWAATKRATNTEVTCPYCRSKWEGKIGKVDPANINIYNKVGEDGYYNVADQLGMSTTRDYSTYSRWWSRHPNSYRNRYRW